MYLYWPIRSLVGLFVAGGETGGVGWETMFSARSRYPRPAVLCRPRRPRAGPLCLFVTTVQRETPVCHQTPSTQNKAGVCPTPIQVGFPHGRNFGCSDYASICSGIIVCMSAFNISGILRPPPVTPHVPPFFNITIVVLSLAFFNALLKRFH